MTYEIMVDLLAEEIMVHPRDDRPVDSRESLEPDVPFLDLTTTHESLVDEILLAWEKILREGAFVGGSEMEAFEIEYAGYVGASECVTVGSGTDALILALRAMGLRPGDEVITVPNTFIATVQAIVEAGGRPVLVDVDPDTGTLDPSLVERAISPRTRVLLPVHLYGQPAEMDPLIDICERHGLQILEDACQAHGATYRGRPIGSTGTAAFSFYPSKNLGACGDGGAVTTNDPDLAGRIRMLRNHGQADKHVHAVGGINSRMDALQAAVLRIKLRYLDGWIAARRNWAARYDELLADTDLELPTETHGSTHAYHLYVVRHPMRNRLRTALVERGIETGLHYPVPVHLQGAFRNLGLRQGAFPNAERWASQGLSLPMYPELTEEAVVRVSNALADAFLSPDVSARRPA
jgi:dTDP-4-amino-4,6-dideoxygalactose transaminase